MVLGSEIFRINNKAIIEFGRFRMISRIMATSFPGSSPTRHPERERERPPSVIHAINVICQSNSVCIFNNYSPKAQLILLNNPGPETKSRLLFNNIN